MRWLVWVICWGCAILGTSSLLAREPGKRIYYSESSDFQIKAKSVDPLMSLTLMLQAEQAAQVFSRVFGETDQKSTWIILDWSRAGDREGPDSREAFPSTLSFVSGERIFSIEGYGSPSDVRESIFRSVVICLTQARVLGDEKKLEMGDILQDPPLWFTEGLIFKPIHGDPSLADRIVLRYAHSEHYPSLAEIQSWAKLSDYYLERKWQQAFCVRVLEEATETIPGREALELWLKKKICQGSSVPYWSDSPTNRSWWGRGVRKVRKKSRDLLDWDQTANELRSVIHFSAAIESGKKKAEKKEPEKKKSEKEKSVRLISLFGLPKDDKALKELPDWNVMLVNLMRLELDAHVLWKQSISYYRNALAQWMHGDYKGYLLFLAKARESEKSMEVFHARVKDRLDWYGVNHPMGEPDIDYIGFQQLQRNLSEQKGKTGDIFERQLTTIQKQRVK